MAKDKEEGEIKMIGIFGSYVVTVDEGGLTVGTDIVDLIYEQEKLRYPEYVDNRDKFRLVNFNLVAPPGTQFTLNNSEHCKVVITDTKTLSIPSHAFEVTNCTLLADCGSINCRYLY
jgi:hypothetical protein